MPPAPPLPPPRRWPLAIALALTLAALGPPRAHAQPADHAAPAPDPRAFMVVTAWRGAERLAQWSGRAAWDGRPGTYIATVTSGQLQWAGDQATGVRVQIEDGAPGMPLEAWIPGRATLVKVVVSAHGFGDDPSGGQGAKRPAPSGPPRSSPAAPERPGAPDPDDRRAQPTRPSAPPGRADPARPRAGDPPHAPAQPPGTSPHGSPRGDPTGQRHGRPPELGGVADAYASTLAGQRHGDPEGGTGGQGQPGDAGARGGWGLIGVLDVPRGWRAAAEVAIIGGEVLSPSAAYQSILERGVGRASIVRVRRELRKRAERFARTETRRLEAQFADELAAMPAKERTYLLRATEHQKQRHYFHLVERGARNRARHLRTKLSKTPDDPPLTRELSDADKIQTAAAVKPIEGRMPLNHEYAGTTYPLTKIDPAEYPGAVTAIADKGLDGVRFSRQGFPDFTPWIHREGDVVADVRISYIGTHRGDVLAARKVMRKKLGDPSWTEDIKLFTWHHHEDLGRMILVPKELHRAVGHTGGKKLYRMATGDYDAYQ